MVEEVGIVAEAHFKTVLCFMHRLQTAGLGLVRTLWPDTVQPHCVRRLARWLEAGSAHVNACRASADLDCAEMVINFVKSWHPDLDMGMLTSRRVCTEVELATRHACMEEELATVADLAVRVSDLTSFAEWDAYVPEQAVDGTPLLEDDYALAFDEAEGSADETGGEEIGCTTEAYVDAGGEAHTAASIEAAWAGADGASTS
ncbi:hypothetical protein ZWY2020_021020 [Hordeum vulgare]|nr:hypothetical protein ZWY2020_021020 [Hordeum vulgare]